MWRVRKVNCLLIFCICRDIINIQSLTPDWFEVLTVQGTEWKRTERSKQRETHIHTFRSTLRADWINEVYSVFSCCRNTYICKPCLPGVCKLKSVSTRRRRTHPRHASRHRWSSLQGKYKSVPPTALSKLPHSRPFYFDNDVNAEITRVPFAVSSSRIRQVTSSIVETTWRTTGKGQWTLFARLI